MIEKQDIKRYLPHREPFLFVDGVTEIIKDEYIKGFKEVKEDEYYFKGHFPDNPVVLISDGGDDFSDISEKFNCKY